MKSGARIGVDDALTILSDEFSFEDLMGTRFMWVNWEKDYNDEEDDEYLDVGNVKAAVREKIGELQERQVRLLKILEELDLYDG